METFPDGELTGMEHNFKKAKKNYLFLSLKIKLFLFTLSGGLYQLQDLSKSCSFLFQFIFRLKRSEKIMIYTEIFSDYFFLSFSHHALHLSLTFRINNVLKIICLNTSDIG